jgi:thiamine biosynthesis lipoprotein
MVLMASSKVVDRRREPASRNNWLAARGNFDFQAMGTTCRISFAAASDDAVSSFKRTALAWVAGFENKYSRFKPDSLISRINNSAGTEWVEIDGELTSIFSLCDWYHWATRGVFDPSALPLMKLWDYHAEHPAVPADGAVKEALELTGWKKMLREGNRVFLPVAGMGIDIGGIGKEYAVDRVIAAAADAGICDIMVDFGHDVRVHGVPPEGGPWRIGLEDPFDTGRCWCGVAVTDRAVASSGDYLRNFVAGGKRYGHILDPRTGRPVAGNCRSVSVIAQTCTEAGMLARTAFIMGQEDGLDLIGGFAQAEGCIITDTKTFETHGFHEYVIQNKTSKRSREESIS